MSLGSTLEVVTNEYMCSWLSALSGPFSANGAEPSGGVSNSDSAATASLSFAASTGAYAPSQYWRKSLDSATQFSTSPAGAQYGGWPAGLNRKAFHSP